MVRGRRRKETRWKDEEWRMQGEGRGRVGVCVCEEGEGFKRRALSGFGGKGSKPILSGTQGRMRMRMCPRVGDQR